MTTFDLAIVGAGPAGMTAATTAIDLGLSVLIIDEQQQPGGQIFRQPAAASGVPTTAVPGYRWGQKLIAKVQGSDRLSRRLGATVLGVLRPDPPQDGFEVVVRGPTTTESISTRYLLIATGAMDLPVAFPGWTLPGVVTAGGIQTMLKAQQLLMARKVVMTGGHPLLLVVAGLLLDKGGTIAGVAIPHRQTSVVDLARALPVLPGHFSVLTHAATTAVRLRLAKVPLHRGAIVTAARGDGRVEEVDITPLAPGNIGQPNHPPRTVVSDGVVIGYGFQPSTDLARQAGCDLRWDSSAGGWIVDHDEDLQTTIPSIYVAGEPTGVAGADQARIEGRLAALSIAAAVAGRTDSLTRDIRRTKRALRRAGRFSSIVQHAFEPPRDALLALTDGGTIVCRCEDITRDSIEAAIDASPFISTVNALKLECRTGMGPCQGRYCELTTSGLLAQRRGTPIAEVGHFNAQFPTRPATVSQLSDLKDDVAPDPHGRG